MYTCEGNPLVVSIRPLLQSGTPNEYAECLSMLPGIPPTGKRIGIPFIAVVNIRGDRLYHENISWDQASVFV
jgi:hypothetical protein